MSYWLWSYMRIQVLLVFLLMTSQVALSNAQAEGRAIEFDVELSRYDWLSNETIPVQIELKNAPYNTNFTLIWDVRDVNNNLVANGSLTFKATGTITAKVIELKHIYSNEHFYTFSANLLDSTGGILSQDDHSFTMFQNRKIAPIGNLVAFGDSLSDMGNAKDSILNVPDVPPY